MKTQLLVLAVALLVAACSNTTERVREKEFTSPPERKVVSVKRDYAAEAIGSFSSQEKRLECMFMSGDGEAKYWLEPNIELSKQNKYSSKQLSEIKTLVEEHKDELIAAWQEHFGD